MTWGGGIYPQKTILPSIQTHRENLRRYDMEASRSAIEMKFPFAFFCLQTFSSRTRKDCIITECGGYDFLLSSMPGKGLSLGNAWERRWGKL